MARVMGRDSYQHLSLVIQSVCAMALAQIAEIKRLKLWTQLRSVAR